MIKTNRAQPYIFFAVQNLLLTRWSIATQTTLLLQKNKGFIAPLEKRLFNAREGKMGNGTIRETVEDDNLTRQLRAIRKKDKGKDNAAKM